MSGNKDNVKINIIVTMVHVKDRLPTQKQRNVVYKMPCSECPSSYVGQTGRQFGTRMKEHKGFVILFKAIPPTRVRMVANLSIFNLLGGNGVKLWETKDFWAVLVLVKLMEFFLYW